MLTILFEYQNMSFIEEFARLQEINDCIAPPCKLACFWNLEMFFVNYTQPISSQFKGWADTSCSSLTASDLYDLYGPLCTWLCGARLL